MKIVPLRQEPSLADIVGQLRGLADRIENGEYEQVSTLYALLPRDGDYPIVFGWGDVEGKNDPAIQCELAKMWLLMNMVKR